VGVRRNSLHPVQTLFLFFFSEKKHAYLEDFIKFDVIFFKLDIESERMEEMKFSGILFLFCLSPKYRRITTRGSWWLKKLISNSWILRLFPWPPLV
jgi:hypothetical protein